MHREHQATTSIPLPDDQPPSRVTSALSAPGCSRFCVQNPITLQPAWIQIARSGSAAHGAPGLVSVSAGRAEPAAVDQLVDLREARGQFGGVDAPEPQLAQPGRIRDVTAALEGNELRRNGGVLTLVHGFADR